MLPHVFELSESDLFLSLLSMVDMGLVGGLIVMVMYSSYENFVSRLDLDEKDSERLGWLDGRGQPQEQGGLMLVGIYSRFF